MANAATVLDDSDDVVVHIIEDDNPVTVDPVTGAVEIKQPDGGVIVHLDGRGGVTVDDEDDDTGHFDNLVDKIDPAVLLTISNDLYEAVAADDQSRKGKLN